MGWHATSRLPEDVHAVSWKLLYKRTSKVVFEIFLSIGFFLLVPRCTLLAVFWCVCGLWSAGALMRTWWVVVFLHIPSIESCVTRFRELRSQLGRQLLRTTRVPLLLGLLSGGPLIRRPSKECSILHKW